LAKDKAIRRKVKNLYKELGLSRCVEEPPLLFLFSWPHTANADSAGDHARISGEIPACGSDGLCARHNQEYSGDLLVACLNTATGHDYIEAFPA
jgi:hypothetical protein